MLEKTYGQTDASLTYGYGYEGRLTSASRTGGSAYEESCTYDDDKNRLSKTKNGTVTSYEYDHASQFVKETTGTTTTYYGYDRAGNLTLYGNNSLEYDAANKWVSGTVSNNVLALTYDGLGRRASRSVNGAEAVSR